MDLNSIDLAIKYHSLEDEEWAKSGGNFINITAGKYIFKDVEFLSADDLLAHIEKQSSQNILVLYDNSTNQTIIASVLDYCKKANAKTLVIKSTEGYGR